jgi:hypothetical protein
LYRKKYYIHIIFIIFIFLLCGCSTKDSTLNVTDTYSKFKGNDLHLVVGDKELFWFSGIHSNDPKHRMFKDLKNEFSSYKPDLVLVEGNTTHKNEYKDEIDAILNGGEPGYVAYLAKKNKIEVQTIEPSWSQQFECLLKKYSENDVLAMYVLRQVFQYQREIENRQVDFFNEMEGFIISLGSSGFPIEKDKVTHDYIINIIKPYTGYCIDDITWKEVNSYELVYSEGTIVHDIWQETINFRDQHAIDLIREMKDNYNRIFIMMGADHIIAQSDKLKDIYK